MAKGLKGKSLGAWIFLIGVILAVILGLFGTTQFIMNIQDIILVILLIAGLVIGFMNVTGGETQKFLLASVVLVIVSVMAEGAIPGNFIGGFITAILKNLLALIVPATIVVALKSIFVVAKN
ncbi:MAG: hypothetical protein PHF67_02505 [Candidatus Nanoarchaeia archaeon]|nr:hypothetical protein [Candidatus Nanoarchaeia archaeon]